MIRPGIMARASTLQYNISNSIQMGHYEQAQLSSITLSFLTVTVENFYFWCIKSDFDAVKKVALISG